MYVVFFGYGNYKTFRDRTEALIFCKSMGITWIDEVE